MNSWNSWMMLEGKSVWWGPEWRISALYQLFCIQVHYDLTGSNMAILQGFFFFSPHLFLSFCDVISSSTICFSYCSSLFPSLPSFFTVLTQYLSYDYRPYFQYINIGRKVMNSFQFHFCNDNMRSSVDTCPTNWWKTTEKKNHWKSLEMAYSEWRNTDSRRLTNIW